MKRLEWILIKEPDTKENWRNWIIPKNALPLGERDRDLAENFFHECQNTKHETRNLIEDLIA
jgi:hypothetical protein